MVNIHEMAREDGKTLFYIFDDVAELFWPSDYGKSNHIAEDRIIDYALRDGCGRTPANGLCHGIKTPHGPVYFDSESGCFECHATEREPVEYVRDIIVEICKRLAAAREVLS